MEKGGYVYIMTTQWNTVLYTGVTSELFARMAKHIEKFYSNSFTAKYNVNKLVYYKWFPSIKEAIAYEKKIKGGSRKKKIALINEFNPSWRDLFLRTSIEDDCEDLDDSRGTKQSPPAFNHNRDRHCEEGRRKSG